MFSLLPLALPGQAPAAGSGSIDGRVQNLATGRYLVNARVVVLETGREALTDEFGRFRLAAVPAGEVTLIATYPGLDAERRTVAVEAGQSVQASFQLTNPDRYGESDNVVKMEAFVVQAQETDGTATALNEQRVARNLKSVVDSATFGDVTEGNVGEFIKYLPGISVDYVAADVRTISVRGFQDTFTPVTVDGNRMASAASSGATRSFELEQVSMNNVARIEVVKVPTPDMGADSLGGAVNLISKNAFERDKPEFKYRGYLSLNSEDIDFKKTPGPGRADTWKIRPGFDFTYTNPVTSNFGIVINALRSDQFNEQHRSRNRWEFTSGAATPANPYLRRYELQDGPKETLRESFGVNADWRIADNTVLSFGYQLNNYDSFFGNRNRVWNIGSSAPAFDGSFAQGRNRAGEVTINTSFREKYGRTYNLNANLKHYGQVWNVEAGVFTSNATNHYRDTSEGHFSNIGLRARRLTMRFDGIQAYRPGTITALDSSGDAFDWTRVANFNIRNMRSQPYDSEDTFTGGHVHVRRDFAGLAVPFALKAGASWREQERDIRRFEYRWDYLGADGRSESSDDGAGFILDGHYINQDPHFGFPVVQWPSPYLLYDHFKANPSYFRENFGFNIPNNAQNDYFVTETVTGAYAMFDTKLMDGRLAILGGARLERTEVDGRGFLNDPDAIYQRNSAGGFVRDASGNRVLKTTDAREQLQLQWQSRAASASRSYDDIYPSVHFVYNVSDNLLARFSYARTLGRPDFSQILPGVIVDPDEEPDPDGFPGRITARNTGLEPWTADNFDLSLEYYMKPAGVVSVGVFQKDIKNFFGNIATVVTPAVAADFGLDSQYVGWELLSAVNAGDAKIQGIEANYVQQLNFLPGWARHFSVFGNGTFLHLEGSNSADFRNFIKQSGNWGFSWSRNPVDVKIKWNHRGRQQRSPQSFDDQAYEYYEPRTYLDVNFEWRFNKRFTLFVNARNILNVEQDRAIYAPQTPQYARTERREEFGVQYAIGLKGTF